MDTSIRKRVCRACDRCRLKKSKVNGNENVPRLITADRLRSVTGQSPALGAKQTMQSACSESGGNYKIRRIRMGEFSFSSHLLRLHSRSVLVTLKPLKDSKHNSPRVYESSTDRHKMVEAG